MLGFPKQSLSSLRTGKRIVPFNYFSDGRHAPAGSQTGIRTGSAAGAQPRLRQDEGELRRIVDLIPQHIVVLDAEGTPIFVNRQVLEYTGLSDDEVRAGNFRERAFHPDDVERLREERQKALSGTVQFENEQRVRGKDGQFRWFLIRYNPLLEESGRVLRWYCAATEITERKQAEENLRRVIDTIPTLAWCMLPDGTNEFLNKNWHEYTGLSAEESNGWGWQSVFHPDDLPPLMEKWKRMLVSGEPDEIEARLRRHDGVYRWFLIRAEAFRDKAGTIFRWYGTSTDIDDRKQAEDKLRQSEQEVRQDHDYLRCVLDTTPALIHTGRPDGYLDYFNQRWLDYLDVRLEDICGWKWTKWIHPEDLDDILQKWHAALASGEPFEAETRVRRADGQYRRFLHRKCPLRDKDGKIVQWFGSSLDIEERKRANDALRSAFEEIKNLKDQLHRENVALKEEIDKVSMFEDIVGSSQALRRVLGQVAKVAPTDSTVLILGETGTGKELVARAIHKRSARSEGAFISVNCSAIPPSLIASELFGHEKGAFTGATQRRLGRFESANGGTIFLDEVGDLPPETQIALLRVLQEREIERVGSNKEIPVDVRVLAATHRDLDTLVNEGKFREDLLYRLNVVPIQMPSLRDRADDIPVLVEYFVDRFGKKAGKKFRTMDKGTAKLFEAYEWPGNVRELQNVIERAVILSEGDIFQVDATWLKRQAPQPSIGPTLALNSTLQRREREMIEAALAETGGRVSGPDGAAAKLNLPRATLDAKIKRLGINKYQFRAQRSA
jgi:formate hydrogenlyase transcriptional activator